MRQQENPASTTHSYADMIGALTDLTGRRFGYDIPAWRRWWKARKQGRR